METINGITETKFGYIFYDFSGYKLFDSNYDIFIKYIISFNLYNGNDSIYVLNGSYNNCTNIDAARLYAVEQIRDYINSFSSSSVFILDGTFYDFSKLSNKDFMSECKKIYKKKI